jgi:Plasmid encoded RepA protein
LQNSYARRVSPMETVRQRSMESAGTALKQRMPELVVSKQKLRQAEGIALVRSKREEGSQVLAFSSRPFVMCGLPVRKPPAGQLLFERRNGAFLLQITGHPEFGLPYGQDRLVPIYLATLAVQQKSQTVRFRSGSEMLDTFGMSKGGKEYRRLVQAFERIFGATIFFGSDRTTGKAKVVQRSRFNFLREARIWYNRHAAQNALSEDFENIIVLSDDFYHEITTHPIPTDLEAVKVLAGAPAVLDLFMWLSYRCHIARGEERIPIFGPYGLAQQLGSIEYSRPRRFRVKLEQWLDSIRVLWPGCPAGLSADGGSLKIKPAAAVTVRGA